jgi:chromosome segregation ATPase
MVSRSHEAAGDGWEHDGAPTAHHDPATGGATERERRLRARVAELEAELDRSERRIQQVVDEYEALLERERRARGALDRLRAWLGLE